MPRKKTAPSRHTGQTVTGNTRDIKVERVGPVTIYKRGHSYYLYYRQDGTTQRPKIDGNLAVARATARKMPVLFEAWQLNQESSLQRWEVEARLLAGETSRDIARKCQLPEAVVDAYHDLYYCVRNRLHARDWVMNLAVGRRARQGLTEADQDVILKLYALRGGPVVLDSLVHYFRHPVTIPAAQEGLDAEDLNTLQLHRSIRRSIQLLTLPADAVHFPGLTVLVALLDRKQPAGGPGPVDLIDHFLADSDPESLLKFATAAVSPVPCKQPA